MTTWAFAGTALTTFGRVTLINDYLDTSQKRGGNIVVPFRHGSVFSEKYYSERNLSFGVAISAASATALESTFDNMRKLFGRSTEATLTATMEDTTTRTILAAVEDQLNVDRLTATLAKVVINFKCSEPFFRSGTILADNTTTISAGTVAMSVVHTGTAPETKPTIRLIGPLNNTVITNSTTGHVLTYSGTIASTGTVTITMASTGEYTATNNGTNVISSITHSGGPTFMAFNPGTNTLSIVNTGGTTGTVKVSFYAPYF